MKKTNIFLLIAFGIFLVTLSSCSSSQTFLVQGTPGTVISSPTNQRLAVLDNMGQAQITMKRGDGYYHYLQSQVPGSSLQVPFALDYKNHSRASKRGLLAAGEYTLLAGSIGCSITATACVLAGVEDAFVGYIGIGALVGALGGTGLLFANSADAIESDYDYLQQSTNNDILK